MSRSLCLIVAAAWLAFLAGRAAAEAPVVVASIKPIHSVVAAVMQGVGTPRLLVQGGASPHAYALKPSDARLLQDADAVFWVGGDLEAFLEKPLAALATKAEVVTLSGADTVADPHIWLDPLNVKAMAGVVAATLGAIDTAHRSAYRINAERLSTRLAALDTELRHRLATVAGRPYVVYHDAYGHLERRYGLAAIGVVTPSPERRPGARRLSELRTRIEAADAACVFTEPQFEPRLVGTLIAGTAARTAVLDPLGGALEPGPDHYFALMRALAASLVDCLTP